ncbi:MAG: DUF3194 domain-containing protein [Candidatus Heimdallarchaeota archaeon]|nr:DUF3194 domain-containing protein [Candidatus Heimdallarchaeota archaeon]
MNEKINPSISTVGLRKLTEEELETISEEIHEFVRKFLGKRVPERKIDSYDIIIDINSSKDILNIDVDILADLAEGSGEKEDKLIQEVLEETFSEIEHLLKENYSK